MATLYCDGQLATNIEVADTFTSRWRGLLGRDSVEGALLITKSSSVHTLGMLFPIDVAFVDEKMMVIDTVKMIPYRISRPRRRARTVIEAAAGAFEKWGLRPGSRVEVRP